jgi:hypothetical protein
MTSFIRNAPGPLKGARALFADLLEGVADVISPPKDVDLPPPPPYHEQIVSRPAVPPAPRAAEESQLNLDASPPDDAAPLGEPEDHQGSADQEPEAEEHEEPIRETVETEEVVEPEIPPEEVVEPEIPPEETEDDEPSLPTPTELSQAFDMAIAVPSWAKKQDFKVLAIFWSARQRDEGPITAKAASELGDQIDVVIRHENIRKVIRTRLSDWIGTTTIEGSQPPTFQFEMNDDGAAFFEQEYLLKVE